jgi:hypothetical protein
MPGYLIQYNEHPNLKILKNQILSSCGHFIEHWQKKIKIESNFTGAALFELAQALSPCSLAPSRTIPAPSAPTQAMEEGGEEETATRAPSQEPSVPCDADRLEGARGDPQSPAAEPEPSQHASVNAVTGASLQRRQGPRSVELLAELVPVAPAYINPLRSNEAAHPVPSYLPDIAAHSLSLWFAVASFAGAVLDRRSAAAFEHRGANFCRESEEEEHRSRSRASPSSFASSTPRPRRRTVFAARR